MSKYKSKKKITFFLFAYWHDPRWKGFVGATVKIWDFAQNLASFGHDVVLFLPGYKIRRSRLAFKLVEILLDERPCYFPSPVRPEIKEDN